MIKSASDFQICFWFFFDVIAAAFLVGRRFGVDLGLVMFCCLMALYWLVLLTDRLQSQRTSVSEPVPTDAANKKEGGE